MKELILAITELVKELEKHPRTMFLAVSLVANVYILTTLFAHDEKSFTVINAIHSSADSISTIARNALIENSTLKDTVYNCKDREKKYLIKTKDTTNHK